MSDWVGKLLVASPNLPEENWFRRTVIYLYSENAQGVLGVTLNVETPLSVNRLCKEKGIIYPYHDRRVYKGGPVTEQSVIMLHSDEWSCGNTVEGGRGYKLTSDTSMFERLSLGDQPAYWRMFVGLSAWQHGQLELELAGEFPYKKEESWLICDPTDDIIFNYSAEEQWKKAVDLCSQQMINSYL